MDILNHKMSVWLVAEVERVDLGGRLLYVDVLTISSLRAMSATQPLSPFLSNPEHLLHTQHARRLERRHLQPIEFGVSFLSSQNSIDYLVLCVSFATSR